MIDIASGFRIGDALFPWGTRIDAARAACEARITRVQPKALNISCARTYGLDTCNAHITGAGLDPALITSISYAIAMPQRRDESGHWMKRIFATLGLRDTATVTPADRWVGQLSSSLGAPRLENNQYTEGGLFLNWTPSAADNPFLPDWQQRADTLARRSAAYTSFTQFTTAEPLQPNSRLSQHGIDSTALRQSLGALHQPHILPTPSAIAERLGPHDFALWCDHTHWCLSTHWDSVQFTIDDPVTVTSFDMLPAKGPGYLEISINGWSIADCRNSGSIPSVITALCALPCVTVKTAQEYDY